MYDQGELEPAGYHITIPQGADWGEFCKFVGRLPDVVNVDTHRYRVDQIRVEFDTRCIPEETYRAVTAAIERQYNLPEAQRALSR